MSSRRGSTGAWWVGLVYVVGTAGFVGYQFSILDTDISRWPVYVVLSSIPAVYLVLMYWFAYRRP
jgi:hypothetical protein